MNIKNIKNKLDYQKNKLNQFKKLNKFNKLNKFKKLNKFNKLNNYNVRYVIMKLKIKILLNVQFKIVINVYVKSVLNKLKINLAHSVASSPMYLLIPFNK